MKRKRMWAVAPQLEIRLRLHNELLGTEEDELHTRELADALKKLLVAKGLGEAAHMVTAEGRTSLFFEGDHLASSMYEAVHPFLQGWHDRPYLVLLRHGLLFRRTPAWECEPYVAHPATLIVHIPTPTPLSAVEDDGQIKSLFDEIDAALTRSDDGWVDEPYLTEETCDIVCYGHTANRLWEAIAPVLEKIADREVVSELCPELIGYEVRTPDYA